MGHTYNKISKFDDAERCLKGALSLLDTGIPQKPGQKGGIFLGLANVQQAKGNLKDALESRLQALDVYNQTYGHHPHSLCAKANLYVGQTYIQMVTDFRKAEPYFREAYRLFKITCADSPLTLSSLCELGDLLIFMNTTASLKEAHTVFKEALDMQPRLETIHVSEATHVVRMAMDHPPAVAAKDDQKSITPEIVREMYKYLKEYFPLLSKILATIKAQKTAEDMKLLDFYMALTNFYFLGGEQRACQEVVERLMQVTGKLDKDHPKVKEAVAHCSSLLGFYGRNQD